MTALDTIKQAVLGVPFDPGKQPSRQGVVKAFSEMQTQLEAAQAGAFVRSTLTALISFTAAPASAMAWVVNDPTQANNGIYENTGVSNAAVWTRRADIPQFIVTALNTGEGSGNAIEATTDRPIPVQDGRCLILVPIVAENTDQVTISFNSQPFKKVVSSDGSELRPQSLKIGMIIAGYITNSGLNFQLISQLMSNAIVDAIENAEAFAIAAENSASLAETYLLQAQQQINNVIPNVIRFSGDGSRVEFDLGTGPINENLTNVYVNGIYQQKNTYSIDNFGKLVFSIAPASGTDNIEVAISGATAMFLVANFATQPVAEAGTDTIMSMNSLRTKQSIIANAKYALVGTGETIDEVVETLGDRFGANSGDAAAFWEQSFFGNPAHGKTTRLNRVFVGVAAQSGGQRPASPSTWVDDYFEIITDSQLAVVSALGSLAITGVARSSDFRTWTGGTGGGAQGVSGFSVNDDTLGAAVGVGVYGEAIHLPNVPGITEAAEFTINNGGDTIELKPGRGIEGGSTFSINLSAGFRGAYLNNVSAYMVLAGNSGHGVRARTGIVFFDGLDPDHGSGGRGVFMNVLREQSLLWSDELDNDDAEIWSNNQGLRIKTPAGRSVIVDDLSIDNVKIGSEWEEFNSIIQASAGGAITGTAKIWHKTIGKTVEFRCSANIVANNTGSGTLEIFLPFNAKANAYAGGRASGLSKSIQGIISASDNKIALIDGDGNYFGADGRSFFFNGVYERI